MFFEIGSISCVFKLLFGDSLVGTYYVFGALKKCATHVNIPTFKEKINVKPSSSTLATFNLHLSSMSNFVGMHLPHI